MAGEIETAEAPVPPMRVGPEQCIHVDYWIAPPVVDGKVIPLTHVDLVHPEVRCLIKRPDGEAPLAMLYEPQARRWRMAPEQ